MEEHESWSGQTSPKEHQDKIFHSLMIEAMNEGKK